jgi:Ser/Thr protein kinase RdoA (MazF antagonist)
VKTPLRALEPALQHYGVTASAASEVYSGFNLHFRLTTPDGDKHLIIFRPQAGKPPRDFQFDLWQHILAQGFTLLPQPVKTVGGQDYAGTPLGTVALTEWVPGESGSLHEDWSGPMICKAASVLADLHGAARHFRPDPAEADRLAPLYLPADAWVDRVDQMVADFGDRTAADAELMDAVRYRVEETLARFDAAAYESALAAGTTVVHGDYRPGNLVINDSEIAAVIDLDAAFWESRVYDLAYAAFQFGGKEGVYPQPGARPGAYFVRSYCRRWPLTEAEQTLLPFFLRQVVLKRLLVGRDAEPRLALLDQLDRGLEDALVRAAA